MKKMTLHTFVSVENQKFIDPQGRQLILHGLNMGDKSADSLGWHGRNEFSQLHDWGFNTIRLVLQWRGIEPEPGQFNEAYLTQIDQWLEWAANNKVYVILDMHQDLYGHKTGGNGAPEWATLDDGKPNTALGSAWNDAYITNQALHAAFTNFWANKTTADGIGVQDHFAKMWQHVAQRYAGNPTVVGYDILNEPFPGPVILDCWMQILSALSNGLAQQDDGKAPSAFSLMQQWMDAESRSVLMKRLCDAELYASAIDAAELLFQNFDRDQLSPFYQRVANAIREVDSNHIIFMGPQANMGVISALIPINCNGEEVDSLQAYAPHVYDLVTDTPDVAEACSDRLELMMQRHKNTARRMQVPMIVTEWGAYYNFPKTLPAALNMVRLFESNLCGDLYWDYRKDLVERDYFPALCRPYPLAVAGELVEYKTNYHSRVFECAWIESPRINSPTIIYLPASWYPNGYVIEPANLKVTEEEALPGSKNEYVYIDGAGKNQKRSIKVKPVNQ